MIIDDYLLIIDDYWRFSMIIDDYWWLFSDYLVII